MACLGGEGEVDPPESDDPDDGGDQIRRDQIGPTLVLPAPEFPQVAQEFVHWDSHQPQVQLDRDEGQRQKGHEPDQQRIAFGVDPLLIIAP